MRNNENDMVNSGQEVTLCYLCVPKKQPALVRYSLKELTESIRTYFNI